MNLVAASFKGGHNAFFQCFLNMALENVISKETLID
jgi:hypothetical protein